MQRRQIAHLVLLLAASTPLRALADDYYFSPTDERVRVSLGAMHVASNTQFRADSNAGTQGTYIDAEHEFGLDGSDFEPKFQAVVRVATRHRLSFDYFTLDRTGNTIIGTTPIAFRDVILPSGAPVSTKLDLRTFGITYAYSFWHSEKLEIAASLGVHSTDISSEARVQTPTIHIIQQQDVAGAIPTVGLDATWVISKRFYVEARAQYLRVDVNRLNGSLGFYEFNALYRYRPNVSAGLGYTQVKANLNYTDGNQTGLFDFNSRGPEIFIRVGF